MNCCLMLEILQECGAVLECLQLMRLQKKRMNRSLVVVVVCMRLCPSPVAYHLPYVEAALLKRTTSFGRARFLLRYAHFVSLCGHDVRDKKTPV